MIIAALGIALSGSVFAAVTQRILILYDQGADKREPALTDAKYLENLMGHFNTAVRLAPVAEYQAGRWTAATWCFTSIMKKNSPCRRRLKRISTGTARRSAGSTIRSPSSTSNF